MVANASPPTPVSINTLILLAYKRAGLLPVEAQLSGANMTPKLEHGRTLLNLIIGNLATEGFTARTMEFYDLPIVAGEPYYTLPNTVLDVHEDAMFIPSENLDTKFTSGELACRQVDLDTWNKLTVKGSESTRPQLYVTLRSGGAVQLRFWPVPTDAGVMRIKTVRKLGSNSDGKATVDLQEHWQDTIVWLLASYVAVDSSLSTERCAFLANMAAAKKKACVVFDHEHTSTTAMLVQPSQWSR